jgi:hypothetical protein
MFLHGVNEGLPQCTKGQTILHVHVVGLELNPYRFPDDQVCVSEFFGHNTRVQQLANSHPACPSSDSI